MTHSSPPKKNNGAPWSMGAGGGLKHRGEPSSGEQPSEGLAPCRPEVVMDPWCGGKIHPEDPVDPHEQ